MRIRNLEQHDFQRLWQMDWSPLVKERDTIYLLIAVDHRETSFVAEEDGEWLGVLLSTRSADGEACFVNHLYVMPQRRGRGIGSALVEHLKQECHRLGVRRIWLFCAAHNRRFYERLGFREDYSFLEVPLAHHVKEVKRCLLMVNAP